MKMIQWIGAACAIVPGMTILSGCDSTLPNTNGESSTDADADSDTDTDTDTDIEFCDEGTASAVCASGPVNALQLNDAHNYRFISALDVSSVEVKSIPAPNLQDLTFDWSGLTHSFMDEDMAPQSGVDMLVITAWRLSPEALKDAIINDKLFADVRIGGGICNETGGRMIQSNMMSGSICKGETIAKHIPEVASYFDASDPAYDPARTTHLAIVKSGMDLDGDLNVKMVKFFTLNQNSQNTTVVIDNNSATLNWRADLRNLARIPVSIGNSSIDINWSNIYFNGLNNPFNPSQITRVVVAHYPMNVCELEKRFLHLETIHDAWYEINWTTAYVSVNLSQLVSADGNSFPGITNDGIWMVALFCGECNNPAPWFMTILQPC